VPNADRSPSRIREPQWRALLVTAGVSQLGLGVWMAAAPGSFFRALGPFGVANSHYLRDVSTLYLALGIVLLVAVFRASWRAPVLAFAALQYAFHTLNHLVDVGKSDPGWVGPVDAALLGGTAILFGALAAAAVKAQRR
jgi:hypothetical protein